MNRHIRQQIARRDDGFVAPTTMVLLVALLVFSALAIDAGSWMAQTSRQQRAADAAALAAVVWLPDTASATAVALETAERNGFENGVDGVSVTVTFPNETDVQVSINAPGELYFGSLVTSSVDFTRDATARYVLPVPMGSPRNHLGIDQLPTSPENFRLSINTWCADKIDGDRHASQYENNDEDAGDCPTPTANPSQGMINSEYISPTTAFPFRSQYSYYVEAPEGRTSDLQVRLWKGQYTPTGSIPEDRSLGDNGAHIFTYRVRAADGTVFDDTDNPVMAGCTKTSDTITDDYSYLGSSQWTTLCTITPAMASGRYIVDVFNNHGSTTAAGLNVYGLVAKYTASPETQSSLCDGRLPPPAGFAGGECPRVYARDNLSIHAGGSSGITDFFLAQIDEIHEGKTLELTLYDPAENADYLEIHQPVAGGSAGGDWARVTFDYTSTSNYSPTNSTSGTTNRLSVSSGNFHAESLVIRVDLTGYTVPNLPSGEPNPWWKVRYRYNASPNDRTTWSAKIVGDPVHLVD